jgi:hypothetical protein
MYWYRLQIKWDYKKKYVGTDLHTRLLKAKSVVTPWEEDYNLGSPNKPHITPITLSKTSTSGWSRVLYRLSKIYRFSSFLASHFCLHVGISERRTTTKY